jgi:hypothetical protein
VPSARFGAVAQAAAGDLCAIGGPFPDLEVDDADEAGHGIDGKLLVGETYIFIGYVEDLFAFADPINGPPVLVSATIDDEEGDADITSFIRVVEDPDDGITVEYDDDINRPMYYPAHLPLLEALIEAEATQVDRQFRGGLRLLDGDACGDRRLRRLLLPRVLPQKQMSATGSTTTPQMTLLSTTAVRPRPAPLGRMALSSLT